jgi:hypothetical protein
LILMSLPPQPASTVTNVASKALFQNAVILHL